MNEPDRSRTDLCRMFGANLRLLASRYPTVTGLSKQLDINRTQFNRYLSGESFPRPDVLDRICRFFDVDARILLSPIDEITARDPFLQGGFVSDFHGAGVSDLNGTSLPGGFYHFSRRSFVETELFISGLLHVFHSGHYTFVRGFEPRKIMRRRGLADDARSREFRGYASRMDEGVAVVASRRQGLAGSFSFLNRASRDGLWAGYTTRATGAPVESMQARPLVYEFLGGGIRCALAAARKAGCCPPETLPPDHLRLLQPDTPRV